MYAAKIPDRIAAGPYYEVVADALGQLSVFEAVIVGLGWVLADPFLRLEW